MSKSEIKNDQKVEPEAKSIYGTEKISNEESISSLSEEITSLKAEISSLQAKLNDSDEKVNQAKEESLRSLAEMENIRRRSQKDVASAHKYGLEKFANALLPILDSMEKAVEAAEACEGASSIAEGVSMTEKMMLDVVKKFGIMQINPVGEAFDPNKHEAIAMQPDTEVQDNHVITVFQKGYELNERIVRPARVLVSKNN